MARAVRYDETGTPEVLYLTEVPDTPPGPGKVAVQVRATGLNPYDAKVRSGFIPLDKAFPRGLGSDVAGTVVAVGEGATYWDGTAIEVGDEVMGTAPGAHADRVIASASSLAIRPDAVPVEVAGALHVAGLTAVSCLATIPIGPGDTVLIGGASGSVGLIAAQLAKAAGARVIGSASTRNAEFVRSLGAEPVEYGEGLADRVRELGTVTAVIDAHGREALDAGVALGVPVDRMVAIAAYAALDELGVHNVERAARTPANLAKLGAEIAAGRVTVPIAATFPLDEIQAAYTALEAPHAPGKIVALP